MASVQGLAQSNGEIIDSNSVPVCWKNLSEPLWAQFDSLLASLSSIVLICTAKGKGCFRNKVHAMLVALREKRTPFIVKELHTIRKGRTGILTTYLG